MISVSTTEWQRVVNSNPNRQRMLIKNLTSAATIYLSYKALPDIDIIRGEYELIGVQEVEYKHYKGEIYALASQVANIAVMEE